MERLAGENRKRPDGRRSIAFARDRSSDIARFADIVGVLARGARILVRPEIRDGSVGIKAIRLRPAAASVPSLWEPTDLPRHILKPVIPKREADEVTASQAEP